MLAVPYLSILGVGYLICRGVKKNEAYRETLTGSRASQTRG